MLKGIINESMQNGLTRAIKEKKTLKHLTSAFFWNSITFDLEPQKYRHFSIS